MPERMIDEAARDRALHRYGLPLCLHVTIAAVDEAAIGAHVGEVREALSERGSRKALLVKAYPPAPREPCYPIWDELDIKLGGGVMDTVNEGQKLVRPRR
jgi:hypothetical protein